MKKDINKYSLLSGIFLIVMGVYSLFIKSVSVEYVDSNGILHENFFLIPLAYLFLALGLLIIIFTIIKSKVSKK